MLLSKFGRSLECREHFPLELLPIGGSRVLDAIFRPLHLLCLGSKAGTLVPRSSLSASICVTNRQILQQVERVDPSQRLYACLMRRLLILQLGHALSLAWFAGAGAAKPEAVRQSLHASLHFTSFHFALSSTPFLTMHHSSAAEPFTAADDNSASSMHSVLVGHQPHSASEFCPWLSLPWSS